MAFKIKLLGDDTNRLPIAHTCFNQLGLYRYSTKAKLRQKLTLAISEYQGFGLKWNLLWSALIYTSKSYLYDGMCNTYLFIYIYIIHSICIYSCTLSTYGSKLRLLRFSLLYPICWPHAAYRDWRTTPHRETVYWQVFRSERIRLADGKFIQMILLRAVYVGFGVVAVYRVCFFVYQRDWPSVMSVPHWKTGNTTERTRQKS